MHFDKDVRDAIEDLIKNVDKAAYNNELNVVDIYPIMKRYFNALAVATLETKTHHLVHEYNVYVGPSGFETFYKVVDLLRKFDMAWNFPSLFGYNRQFDKVNFFGSACDNKEDINKAVEKVVLAINTIADLGFTKACLLPLGILKLQPSPYQIEGLFVVLSYVTLTQEGENWVARNMPNMLVEEGGIPFNFKEQ